MVTQSFQHHLLRMLNYRQRAELKGRKNNLLYCLGKYWCIISGTSDRTNDFWRRTTNFYELKNIINSNPQRITNLSWSFHNPFIDNFKIYWQILKIGGMWHPLPCDFLASRQTFPTISIYSSKHWKEDLKLFHFFNLPLFIHWNYKPLAFTRWFVFLPLLKATDKFHNVIAAELIFAREMLSLLLSKTVFLKSSRIFMSSSVIFSVWTSFLFSPNLLINSKMNDF